MNANVSAVSYLLPAFRSPVNFYSRNIKNKASLIIYKSPFRCIKQEELKLCANLQMHHKKVNATAICFRFPATKLPFLPKISLAWLFIWIILLM
jgi:hypothetical protein